MKTRNSALTAIRLAFVLSLAFAVASSSAQTPYTVSTLYTFPTANTGPTGITVDSHGNIYAAGSFSATPNATGIAHIVPPTASEGNGSAVVFAGGTLFGFADGTGSTAQFGTLEGMATDAAGNIYAADANVSFATVRKIQPPIGVVTTLSGLNGNAKVFGGANGVAVNSSGTVYVSNNGAASGLLQYVPGGVPVPIGVGVFPSSYGVYGVAVDLTNAIYVTVVAKGAFRGGGNFDPTQLYVMKINGSITTQLFALPLEDNSQLEPLLGVLNGTVPIAVDRAGNVYVGWYGKLYLYRDKNAPTQIAAFGSPIVGLASDLAGRIYVATNPLVSPIAGVGPGHIRVVAPAGVAALPPPPTATPKPTPTSPTHLVNIAARAFVGSGSSTVIAGFVISGTTNETVLIRGVGPALTQFSVAGVLAQPMISLFNSAGEQVATNTGWGTNATTTADQFTTVFAKVGAFALPAESADAALLVSLRPGSYTVQLSGVNGSTGNGLLEVYEVPEPEPL